MKENIHLGGFIGAVNFAKEINLSINSPVWKYVKESEENEESKERRIVM